MDKPNMYLVCGMPGAGKTTFSKQFAKNNDLVYISIDRCYAQVGGDPSTKSRKFEAWIKFFETIHEAEERGISIVVETMALTRFDRHEFLSWFPGFIHHIIFIDTRLNTCIANVAKRKERPISERDMLSLDRKLEVPTYEEIHLDKWEGYACIIELEGFSFKYYLDYSLKPNCDLNLNLFNGIVDCEGI